MAKPLRVRVRVLIPSPPSRAAHQVQVALVAALREVIRHRVDVDGHVVVDLEVEVSIDLLGQHGEHLERLHAQICVRVHHVQAPDVAVLLDLLLDPHLVRVVLLLAARRPDTALRHGDVGAQSLRHKYRPCS